MEEKYPKVVVAILVLREGRLLLGKRKGIGEGSWGLPGGHVEYKEPLLQAAKRELKEETGLVADMKFVSVVSDTLRENLHFVHVVFLVENVSGEPSIEEPDRCYEWRWFPLEDLPKDIFGAHKEIIPAFLEGKVFVSEQ